MRLVYPAKPCITIVDFSWDDCYTQENGYAKFCGVNEVHYGLCDSSELHYSHIIIIIIIIINTIIKHNSPKNWILFHENSFLALPVSHFPVLR